MRQHKPKKKIFMRRCKRCNTIFTTNSKFSKICPECYVQKGPKKQRLEGIILKSRQKKVIKEFYLNLMYQEGTERIINGIGMSGMMTYLELMEEKDD